MPNSPQTQLAHPYIELNNQGQRLRFDLYRDEHRLGRDKHWADLLVDESWQVISGHHAVLRREGQHYRIYDGDGKSQPSTNGLFVKYTRIKIQPGFLLDRNVQLRIGQNVSNMIVLHYVTHPNVRITADLSGLRLNLKEMQEAVVELGRGPNSQGMAMVLSAPSVSRCHASVTRTSKGYVLRDHSTNGTYVNKQQITSHTLQNGDLLQIGPFTLLFHNEWLEIFDRGDQLRLDALKLFRKVRYANKEKVILDNVSLAIEPGQLVAIVGGSGTGKSTLMKTLLGVVPTTSGAVLLNGDNLQQNFDLYRSEIGYVPQDDIVHQNLTVAEVLSYACQLRLPTDTDVSAAVTRTLKQVNLSDSKHTLVKQLSGGQRKRVSIAVELLANPKLFFLDEPTSGLDPGLDKKMMQLLRELADQGRTIILVTHATSNLEVCERIIFMGAGGKLCYFGPPQEAMQFFAMPSSDFKYFADVYIKLDAGNDDTQRQENVRQWESQFHQSTAYQQYIQMVLSSGEKSQVSAKPQRQKVALIRQWWILARRYLKLVLRDRFTLLLLFFTAPIGATLIKLALRSAAPLAPPPSSLDPSQAPLALRVLFVFTCATIWVGLSGTAQTIVRESSIYLRERLINLQLLPYVGSKVLIHAGLACLQTFLVAVVILIGFEAPQPDLLPWPVGLGTTTFLTLVASISLGLMISAGAKNPNQANSALPLVLIPQIVFSGILFDLDGMARWVSWLMLSRWSIGAYAAIVDVNSMVPTATPGMILPFEGATTYDHTWHNLALNWGMLWLHSLVCLGLCLWQQKKKDKR